MKFTSQEVLEVYKYELSNNFYFFFKEAWYILEPSTTLKTNWHHKYICDLLQKETIRIANRENKTQDIIINLPFRATKSIIVSQMWNAWAWINYPELRFISSSHSLRIAIRDAKKTRDIINSIWYQDLFGDKFSWTSDQNVKSEYENDKKGKRFVTSTESNLTGEGGDILIWDDANDPKDISDVKLDKTNIWYDDTFYSRLNDSHVGLRIGIQQRIHGKDLTAHIIKKHPEDIFHIVLPAELNEEVRPIELKDKYNNGLFWEWKFSKIELDRYKKVLSATGYSGQLMQRPAPKEGNKIKRDWFKIIKLNEIPFSLEHEKVDIWIDGAYTENTKNDPTALMACVKYNENVYILNSVQKWLELYELLDYFPGFAKANYYNSRGKVFIEPKASGKPLKSMLNKQGYNCIEINDKVVKYGKMGRVNNSEPTIQSGKIILIEGAWNEQFVDECCMFPNGEHDDQLDNLCYGVHEYYIEEERKAFW